MQSITPRYSHWTLDDRISAQKIINKYCNDSAQESTINSAYEVVQKREEDWKKRFKSIIQPKSDKKEKLIQELKETKKKVIKKQSVDLEVVKQ